MKALEDMQQKQKVLSTDEEDQDVIAVVGPLSERAQAALASAVGPGHGWVVIRTPGHGGTEARAAQQTQTALAHAGWWTSTATPGDDLAATWNILMGTRP